MGHGVSDAASDLGSIPAASNCFLYPRSDVMGMYATRGFRLLGFTFPWNMKNDCHAIQLWTQLWELLSNFWKNKENQGLLNVCGLFCWL